MRLALCAPILFGAAVLQAGTFDERIVAPPALGAAAFKVRVKDYFAAYERLQSESTASGIHRQQAADRNVLRQS